MCSSPEETKAGSPVQAPGTGILRLMKCPLKRGEEQGFCSASSHRKAAS